MKNSQYMIDDLQVLAHQGEVTNTNIPFSATQIRSIIRIILDLRGQIIDLEAKNFCPLELTDEEIMDELVKVKHTWVATTNVWFEFEKEELKKAIRAILRKAQEK